MKILLCDTNEKYTGGAETYFDKFNALLLSENLETLKLVFRETNPYQALLSQIEAFNPDIIHFNKYFQFNYKQIQHLRNLGIPLVITVHDFYRVPIPIDFKTNVKAILGSRKMYFDSVIIPSEYYFTKLKMKKFPNIHYVPQFINEHDWKSSKVTRIPKKLLFVGRLEKHKGIFFLLDSFKSLYRTDNNYTLDIVGLGSEYQNIQNYIQRNQLQSTIGLHGFKNKRDLVQFYNSSSILIFPTLSGELFGLSGIESIMNYLPVIASDLNAVKEWCKDGHSGLLFKKGNQADLISKIARLSSDAELYKTLQISGYDYIKTKYQDEYALDKIIEIYNQLLSQKLHAEYIVSN